MNGYISRGSDVMGLPTVVGRDSDVMGHTTVVGRGSDVINSPSYATLNKFTPDKKYFYVKINELSEFVLSKIRYNMHEY
jgi:hypothetical protein